MKYGFLTAASVIALSMTTAAMAEESMTKRTAEQGAMPEVSEQELENAWDDTKETASDAAQSVSNAVEDAYNNVKGVFQNDNNATAEFGMTVVETDIMASELIGSPVYNLNGDRVAKVSDVILNRNGEALMVILADGDFTGLGKLAAFDYSMVTRRTEDGEILAPLTEEMIDTATSFSYDRNSMSETIRTIPEYGYSVSQMMDAELTSPNGDSLATVKDITIENGNATYVVYNFGSTLGVGGHDAVLKFNEADIVRIENGISLRLSEQETAMFKDMKTSKAEADQ